MIVLFFFIRNLLLQTLFLYESTKMSLKQFSVFPQENSIFF